MTTTPFAWTNSALTCLQDCGPKFERIYLKREYRPSTTPQLRGGVVHRVVGKAMLQKLQTQELPTVEEVRDLAADTFTRQWAEGVVLFPDEKARGEGIVSGELKDMVVNLSVLHRQKVAPAVNPVGVERRITVKPKDMDITVEGTLDLVDGVPDGDLIRDTKTGDKSPAKDMADDSQQLTMYGLLRLAETGVLPVGYRLDYLIQTPARKELKHVTLDTERDYVDMRALVDRLNAAVEAAAKGVFVPASPSHWVCSARWCQFHPDAPGGDCKYALRGARRSAA